MSDHLLAYIDPFSGSIILQIIIAGSIGGVAFFRKWLWRAMQFVTGKGKSKQEQSD